MPMDQKVERNLHQGTHRAEALLTVASLDYSQRESLSKYIASLHEEEMYKCSDLVDDVLLRRAQGSVTAYRKVLDLLKSEPIKKRRAVARHEV